MGNFQLDNSRENSRKIDFEIEKGFSKLSISHPFKNPTHQGKGSLNPKNQFLFASNSRKYDFFDLLTEKILN